MLRGYRLLEFPVLADPRGNLTVVEGGQHTPFEIRRVYYLCDVPAGATRGGHAHRALEQIIVALAGSFDVLLNDGRSSDRVRLNRPCDGLYIGPMVWREMHSFSAGAIALVIASQPFDESDYFWDFGEFQAELSRRGDA